MTRFTRVLPGYRIFDKRVGGTEMAEKWSHGVTETSNALDLDEGVFTWDDPKKIAKSLMDSAEASHRRKTSPYRSAMSMLTFYLNRAGKHLTDERKSTLEKAKDELHKLKPAT